MTKEVTWWNDNQAPVKKRCISFACAAKPKSDDKALMPPPPKPSSDATKAKDAPRKTSIKFACPSQQAVTYTLKYRAIKPFKKRK